AAQLRSAANELAEPVITIVPPPPAASSGSPYLASRNAPVRSTASTRFHSSSVVSGTVLATPVPALAHSRSSFPNRSVAGRTAPLTSSAGGAHSPDDVVRAGRVAGQEHRPAAPRGDRFRHPLAAGPVLVEEDQGRPV